ncbi:uncharacterized protein C8R40DRAFT_1169372 [Lentinula edodes]|uniref:uncharacterized protein n=1 Tax=Lentinula edodes TaxID=5353 RepID=UPI001E8DC72A|nr:uncharacterized protein C8R40DRAFT_1169372 [Lentinula edodes]KAH7876247.1 hypothetical protein C8R40DRAFT_1169372 [Lentinula edodes]
MQFAPINDATMSVRKRIPGLGDFETPPPPPPPPPMSWEEKSRDWVENHPWILTPLQIIQPLLPLLRNPHGLPAVKTRVGLAFSDLQSMREVGTLRAAKVLRKEIRVAASMGNSGEMMRGVRVVVVDVDIEGIMRSDTSSSPPLGSGSTPPDAYKAMGRWTASEKL